MGSERTRGFREREDSLYPTLEKPILPVESAFVLDLDRLES